MRITAELIQKNLNMTGVKKAFRYVFRTIAGIMAPYYINKVSKKTRGKDINGKIRVGFIVQMPEIWDKQCPVYKQMLEDEQFLPFLIVVPKFNLENRRLYSYGDELAFFSEFKHGDNLIQGVKDEKTIDLKKYDFDYVFYQRPYNAYLPKGLQTNDLVKFTKVCYLPYAFWGHAADLCGFNRDFFRNVHFGFMESRNNAVDIQKKLNKKYNHILFQGYPVFEDITFESHRKYDTILWTPRWTYSDLLGGSHFFEYKEKIVNLVNKHNDLKVIFRPHPMAFDNYVLQGYMTRQEVDAYLEKLKKNEIVYDSNKMIKDTFANTDILVTDMSSIILPFILSGKPIILCESPIGLTKDYDEIIKGIYIAKNWEEIESYIFDIRNGNDYLREKREEIARKIIRDNKNASARILHTIKNDYMKSASDS